MPEQKRPTPETYLPPFTPSPDLNYKAVKDLPNKPARVQKDPLQFTVTASPVDGEGSVLVEVRLENAQDSPSTPVIFTDPLGVGIETTGTLPTPLSYDPNKKELSAEIPSLEPGGSIQFSYQLKVNLKNKKIINIHSVQLGKQTQAVIFTSQNTTMGIPAANGGWSDVGKVAIHAGKGVFEPDQLISVSEPTLLPNGPKFQLKLDVVKLDSNARDSEGKAKDGEFELNSDPTDQFSKEVFVDFNVAGMIDLKHVPAGEEVYVATYDEENDIWVKVPITAIDAEQQRVTVKTPHFSTWGVGLGESLPQNGANVLLFDQPAVSLFQGTARTSFPIWTPAGRNGMQPDLSLNYSSATLNGVLGDVQAPWVGVGWNIDGMEIVRKITTSTTGYGYENQFALTINGTIYQLVEDTNHPGRYNTDKSSFLWIQRHNPAIGNEEGAQNTTGEWWEVLSPNGKSYRLGYHEDSEQLALMYGYRCESTGSVQCITPDGAYASSGYAGEAQDLVAMRWRVDQEMDPNGNSVSYTYEESHPTAESLTPAFDRASYLKSITYAGIPGEVNSGYSVLFEMGERSQIGDNIPLTYKLWDHFDTKYLSSIKIYKGIGTNPTSDPIRSYEFGYHAEPVPNANGTLVLDSISVIGGETVAPKTQFSYVTLKNRTGTKTDEKYPYPRLAVIENGIGGDLSFDYENDGRGSDSWYNWRVTTVTTTDGLGNETVKGYVYGTPVYVEGTNDLGELIGYIETTESILSGTGSTVSGTTHHFGTEGLDTGSELWVQTKDGNGNILAKSTFDYATDNSRAPFPGWNFHYLYRVRNYVSGSNSLILTNTTITKKDPLTGNVVVQEDHLGDTLSRRTYFEYRPNFSASAYILSLPSRQVVTDANNLIAQDTYMHYDGDLGKQPTRGNLTLIQKVISGNSTSDLRMTYDGYGNMTSSSQYLNAGMVNSLPSGQSLTSTVSFDGENAIFPVESSDPAGNITSTVFDTNLGVPVETTDPNGWQTTTSYDGLGRILSMTPPGFTNPGVVYEYTEVGQDGTITPPFSINLQILDTAAAPAVYRNSWGFYDGYGRIIQTQVKDDDNTRVVVMNTRYDPAQGFVLEAGQPSFVSGTGGSWISGGWGKTTTTEVDALGRVTKVTAPGSLATTIEYNGQLQTSTDPAGRQTSKTMDGFGRIIRVESGGAVTKYHYDILDHLTEVIDPLGKTTSAVYDALGRKVEVSSADTGTWSYTFDAASRMSQQSDARGQTIGFSYDALGRLTEKIDVNTNTTLATYSYGTTQGSIGFRTGMDDQSGETTWQYSNYGLSVTEQRTNGVSTKSFSAQKDWLGRTLELVYPDGEVVTYGHDALGQETSVSSSSEQSALADIAYNVLGQVTSVNMLNGVTVTNDYDSGGTDRLATRIAEVGATTLMDFSYQYDPSGNITRIMDGKLGEMHAYRYDDLNRLTSADAFAGIDPIYREQYQYDQNGNLQRVNEWQVESVVMSSDFEDGALLDWDMVSPDLENIWTVGSNVIQPVSGEHSLVVDVQSDTAVYLRDQMSTAVEQYHSRFFFDANTMIMNTTEELVIFSGANSDQDTLFEVLLRRQNGIYQLAARSGTSVSAWTDLERSWNQVEVEWKVGTGTSASLNLWVGEQQSSLLLENINSTPGVSSASLGAVSGINANMRGQMLFDAFEAKDLSASGQPLSFDAAAPKLFALAPNSLRQVENTPTPTVEPTATRTLIPTPTDTATATHTATSSPTRTPTLTKTPNVTSTKTSTNTPVPSPTPNLTLVAKWSFDESSGSTAYDSVSPKSNGTIEGSDRVPGFGVGAIQFTNSQSRVKIDDAAKLRPSKSFSLATWVWADEILSGSDQIIINKGRGARDYTIYVDGDGHIVFHVNGLSPSKVVGPILKTDQWVQITGVYDQPLGLMRLYINGVQVASELVTGAPSYTNTKAMTFSEKDEAFSGKIDEVALYSGVLNDQEILALGQQILTSTPQPTFTKTNTPPPTPFTKTPTITPTTVISATPTLTATAVGSDPAYGTGADGDLTINSGVTVNLNTYQSGNRSCTDGIAYSVSSLSSTTATLNTTPNSGCLSPGDEVMLIQLDDPNSEYVNTGVSEFLRVYSVVDDVVSFETAKVEHYGSTAISDTNIGIGAQDLKVMLLRVPNYDHVVVNGTLTANTWDGKKYGVLVFRAASSVSGSGSIMMDGKGSEGGVHGDGNGAGGGKPGESDAYGGGGGYGTVGKSGGGTGGITYGDAGLQRIYLGSGGGSGGDWRTCLGGPNTGTCTYYYGGDGGKGGGIIQIAAKTIDHTGSISANGGEGGCSEKCRGADGSGGSILIRSTDATLNQLRANTSDGLGRIAMYGQVNDPVDSIPVPWIGTGWFEVTATPTMTPIVFPSEVAQDFGTGEDGDLVVELGSSYNIHTDHTGTNSACQQGGDAVSYEVKELGNDHARLAVAPDAACLGIGDEILLISMTGDQAEHGNTGNYEFVKVGGIVDDTVYFSTPKDLYYGNTIDSDDGVGTTQKVQLVRVPNYDNVSVEGILTGSAWDGSKNGVIVFRVAGVLSGSGVIDMDGMGYRGLNTIGCGESFTGFDLDGCASTGESGGGRKGGTKSNRLPDGGGGGHKNNGTTGSGAGDGMGGRAYGSSELSRLFPGSAGGMAGCQDTLNNGLVCGSKAGGDGGGVIYLIANQIDMPYGIITSNGKGGGSDTGSGAGGSIRLDGVDIEVGDARVDGGTNNTDGSDGYIAVYYQNSITIDTVDYALNVITNVTVTPEPTVVVVPTIDPATAVWHSRTYNYSDGHPNRITDTTDGDAYTYDANGNQVSRLVGGVTQTLVYNAENRLTSVTANGVSESYLYDGDGVRVGRVRAGEATYLFMGGMYEVTLTIPDATVTDTKSYYTAAGQVFAVRDTDGLSTLLTDHLGSILGEVDGLGSLVGEQRYLPFGEVRGDLGSNPAVELSFTGQRALEGTGLIDYHARQYDPALRSFIQPDPIIPNVYGVHDYNRYLYVHGNPVNYVDPSGNRPCGDGEAVDCDGKIYPTPPLVNNPIEPNPPLNPTVVLAGSCGQASIEKACLDPGAEDVSIWASDPWGNDALIIPYPGSKWGQATSLENYGFFDNLILIGYSAGADSALIYALSHMLKALVLLGPTFSGKIDGQTNLNLESSLNVIDRLVESGTSVVIVDDSGDLNKGMFPPEVMFVPYDNKRSHYGAYSNIEGVVQDRSTPTNLNYWLKDLIWTFIVNN